MRRLAPLSGLVSVGRAVVQGLAFGVFLGTAGAGSGLLPVGTLLLAPVLAGLLGGYAYLRYLRFQYGVAGDTLVVESGVLARQSREIPLERIQTVDTEQNVLNRLLGLVVVNIETAGGSSTEAALDAVTEAEADRLRNLVRQYDRQPEPDEPDPDGDRGTELFALSPRDLLTYAVVSVRPAAPVLTLFGLPFGQDVVVSVLRVNARVAGLDGLLDPILGGTAPAGGVVVFAALTLAEFVAVALVVSAVLTAVEYYGFRLVRDGDDLRYRRGLVRRYSGTIPLAKVQTVTVRENVLMRLLGYATLEVETAGYAGGTQESQKGVAVPLAPREEVYALARDVHPFGEIDVDRPPRRARRRYAARFALAVLAVTAVTLAIDRLALGTGDWWLPLAGLVLVPAAAHLRWRHRGYALDDDALVTRSGFWGRSTRVVPYYRVQTVLVARSPFQRRRDLATVVVDTASSSSLLGGNATAHDIDEAVASELRDDLRERLRADLARRRRRASYGAVIPEFESYWWL